MWLYAAAPPDAPTVVIPEVVVEAVGKDALVAVILPIADSEIVAIKLVEVPDAVGSVTAKDPAVIAPPVVVYTLRDAVVPTLPSDVNEP